MTDCGDGCDVVTYDGDGCGVVTDVVMVCRHTANTLQTFCGQNIGKFFPKLFHYRR